jgi:hypothetical protein
MAPEDFAVGANICQSSTSSLVRPGPVEEIDPRGWLPRFVRNETREIHESRHAHAEGPIPEGHSVCDSNLSVTRLEPQKLEVEILYRLVGVPEEAARELHPTEMLFTLADTRPRLEEILRTWFKQQELLREVFARYFYIVHGPPPDRDHAFESYLRVLETHHRRTAAESTASHEIRERVNRIVSLVPDEKDREWLEEELAHSDEPSLAQRLHQTLKRCPTVANRAIGSRNKRDSFVWKVVNTRNYLTHLDPRKKKDAAEGVGLLTLVYQLRALVEMTLLLELGLDCDQVTGIFERIRRYELIDQMRSQELTTST